MAQMIPNFTGVILAGGLSSRFGSNKALADWRGKSLILHMLDILKPHFPHCLIVTKRPMDYKALGLDVDIVEDVSSSQHPLVGVLSALQHAKGDYSFICGCDMPFLQDRLVEALCEAASGYEAVVPIWRGRRQPLCGVYSQACLAAIRRIMDKAVGDVPFIPWPYGKWGQGPCPKTFSLRHGLEMGSNLSLRVMPIIPYRALSPLIFVLKKT